MQLQSNWKLKLIFLSIFSIAMAYVESSVVVYLRMIYYPGGFSFPLKQIQLTILVVELFREAATIVMLFTVSLLSSKILMERIAYFIFSFGIWDIFYYVFLKIILDWPKSILDWDILFLMPVPWVGPVLAPVVISIILIGSSLVILNLMSKGRKLEYNRNELLAIILGCILVIISFLLHLNEIRSQSSPKVFNWWLYSLGLVTAFGVFLRGVIKH